MRGFPDDLFLVLSEDIRDAQGKYERIESLLRRAYVAMGGCEPEDSLREIKELKEQPQLRAEKEQLEIRVTELLAEVEVKSEEVRRFHTEQGSRSRS